MRSLLFLAQSVTCVCAIHSARLVIDPTISDNGFYNREIMYRIECEVQGLFTNDEKLVMFEWKLYVDGEQKDIE